MKKGKMIGIIAFIVAILFVIFGIVEINQAPEFPNDFYDLAIKDMEAATEMEEEILNSGSTMYKISEKATSILFFIGIILAIISLVKMIKDKEKGKVFPILSIIIIIVFFFVIQFVGYDIGEAFNAGLKAGMEAAQ